jgi:hypothetical protein
MPEKIRMPTNYYLKNRFNTHSYLFKTHLEGVLTRRGAFYLPIEKIKYKRLHPHFNLSARQQKTLLISKNWDPILRIAPLRCYTNRPELGLNFDTNLPHKGAIKVAPFEVITARYPDVLAMMLTLREFSHGARLDTATKACIKFYGFGGLRVRRAFTILRKRGWAEIYYPAGDKALFYEITSAGRKVLL